MEAVRPVHAERRLLVERGEPRDAGRERSGVRRSGGGAVIRDHRREDRGANALRPHGEKRRAGAVAVPRPPSGTSTRRG